MPRDKTGHFYYAWFPTIYEQDTQNLTLAEDGAYRRLIDHYMTTRAPLASSERALSRIVGCSVDEWTPIAKSVMTFFKLKDSHYHHNFCDDIIAGDTARILQAQINGKKGGRPSASKDTEITEPLPAGNPVGLPNRTQPKTTNTTHNNSGYDQDQDGHNFLNGFGVGSDCGFLLAYKPSLSVADKLFSLAPGWDQNWLLEKYNGWIKDKPRPKNPDGAFLGWVKSFTKGKRPSA